MFFHHFYLHSLVWSPHKGDFQELGYESWYRKTRESVGYATVKLHDHMSLVLSHISMWQTDRQIATPPVAKSRSSTAERNNNHTSRPEIMPRKGKAIYDPQRLISTDLHFCMLQDCYSASVSHGFSLSASVGTQFAYHRRIARLSWPG